MVKIVSSSRDTGSQLTVVFIPESALEKDFPFGMEFIGTMAAYS